MKTTYKFLLLTILLITPYLLSAQVTAPSLQGRAGGESLLSLLQSIESSQSAYTIDIVSDGLEELTTKADVTGLDAVAAVKRACKGLPVKVKVHGQHIYVQHERQKTVRRLKLQGVVQDIRAHKDLIGATVVLMNADSTVIEQKEAYRKYSADNGYTWETSEFSFSVPAVPAKYLFRISLEGYQTTYVAYSLDKIGRREHEHDLPPFYLAPEAGTMREVTVTASRVKFYYKGDTIIYNADAFVLAEGSMLDALISQLPGVELMSDGRIYHNGKFVDDLLLNGKEFFRHDRKLMLENLPAYTVRDIAVYDKQTAENEWLGIKDERTQHHVLDVRLKKEFMVGWLVNVEAGGGTDGRYLGRLFAMRHSDFSRLAVVANANNLDDDSKPGESGSWQRGQTNDLRRTERADLNFNASDRNKRWELYGGASVNHQRTEGQTRTVRQNFLSTGDTYDHSYSSRTGEDLHLASSLDFIRSMKAVRWVISPNVKYHHFDHTSDLTSATFNAPVASVSRQLLDDLFSPASSRISLRDTLVNRILRQGQGSGHTWDATLHTSATIKIPHSNENIRLSAGINLIDREEHLFDQQTVNIPDSPPALHHFRDNHPTRDGTAYFNAGYNIPLGEGWRALFVTYGFNHKWQHHRSTLYLLEQDQGLLPSMTEYHQVMDRSNSFDSHFRENSHRLDLNLGYKFNKASYGQIWTLLDGNITLHQQDLDYQRGSIDTTLARTAFTMRLGDWTYLNLNGGHQIGFTLGIEEKMPDLEQRIDLRDDTDPMNIRLGNTSLRTSVTPEFNINGVYRRKLSYHYLEWGYQRTYNAVAMGYVYDPQTGVRTYRPENVDGNYTTDGGYSFHCNLDSTKKYNLDVPLHVTYSQNVDLVGVDSPPALPNREGAITSDGSSISSSQIHPAPSLTGRAGGESVVHRLSLSLGPTFKADIGKHHLDFTCQPVWERFTSTRADFTDFHAFTCRTSLAAILKLPWKLDLSTDLTLYSRTGYADAALNTNDLVWNARLSRPFFKGSLVVMLDGFDILGQLNNVTRTVNGQARTETYTNVMPRYLLAHVVYRFNHQPLKPAEKREKRAARKERRERRKQSQ